MMMRMETRSTTGSSRPLDSTHLEVFLRFSFIFHCFLTQIQIFEFGPYTTGRYRYWSGPVTLITAVPGLVAVGKENMVRTSALYRQLYL
jgi:hypothetical protein